jgi:hypothetical protein
MTLGVALLAAGVVIGPGGATLVILHLVLAAGSGHQFAVPGEFVLAIEEPGEFVIFHEWSGVFQGRTVHASPGLPHGAEIVVTAEATGEEIPARAYTGMSSSSGVTKRESLVAFEAAHAGEYRIAVRGDFEGRVFYVAPALLDALLTAILGATVLGILGCGLIVAGLVIVVVALVRRARPEGGLS